MAGICPKEHWSELYRRALFEEDPQNLPSLLEQARQAIQQRARELWYSPPNGRDVEKERRELDAAAYYLEVLRSLEAKTSGTARQ